MQGDGLLCCTCSAKPTKFCDEIISHTAPSTTHIFTLKCALNIITLVVLVSPGGHRRSEPDEAELLRVSRRLVEDAVSRALQQYKQETLQNGGGPNATAVQPPGNTEETETKTDTTANSPTDYKKWHHQTEVQRLKNQPPRKHQPGEESVRPWHNWTSKPVSPVCWPAISASQPQQLARPVSYPRDWTSLTHD